MLRPLLLLLALSCAPKAPPEAAGAAPAPPPASGRTTTVVPPAPATSAPNPPMVSATSPPPPPDADAVPPHMRPPTEPTISAAPTITSPTAEGFVDGPALFPVIEAQRPVFEACWRSAHEENPALAGHIVVKIDINTAGKVAQGAVVTDPRGELGLEACILRKVMTLSFPPPRNGGVGIVRYPFDFTP